MIFWELFFAFFKIGALTFGGGYAMLPLIQAEVLEKHWMSMEQLVDFVAVSESTPGPFAVNIATYVGTEIAGVAGAFFATLGVVLPSFIIILLVAHMYEKFQTNTLVRGIMSGLKPAVIGLIASAVLSIGQTVFAPKGLWTIVPSKELFCTLGIFVIMLILGLNKAHPILIILLSAVLGVLAGYLLL